MNGYRILEQDGKYGLAYGSNVLLKPTYTSLVITNNDPPEYSLKDFEDDPSVIDVSEYNDYPIVTAEQKQGLASCNGMKLDVKYERIVKLTHCHYLCQEHTKWTLFDFSRENISATIAAPAELTLEKLLQALAKNAPRAHDNLLMKLHYDVQTGEYVSDYRYYYGEQYLGSAMFHGFEVAITKVIIHNDFSTTLITSGNS